MAKWFIGFKAFKGAYLGNIPSKYVSNLLSIYISIICKALGQFCVKAISIHGPRDK